MAKLLSVCLLFLLWGVRQSLAQEDLPPLNTEHDVLAYSNAVIRSLEKRVEFSNLPPSAMPAAQAAVQSAERQLRQCEADLATNHLVGQYKMCANQALQVGMREITIAQGGYRGASASASRLMFYPLAIIFYTFLSNLV